MPLGDQSVDRFRAELVGERLFAGQDTVLEGGEPTQLLIRALSRMHAAIVVDRSISTEGSGSDLWTTADCGESGHPRRALKFPTVGADGQTGLISPAVWALAAAKRAWASAQLVTFHQACT